MSERVIGDDVGSTLDEELDDGRRPVTQYVHERDRGHFSAVLDKKLDEVKPSVGDRFGEGIVLCFPTVLVTDQQLDEAVKPKVHGDLEWGASGSFGNT